MMMQIRGRNYKQASIMIYIELAETTTTNANETNHAKQNKRSLVSTTIIICLAANINHIILYRLVYGIGMCLEVKVKLNGEVNGESGRAKNMEEKIFICLFLGCLLVQSKPKPFNRAKMKAFQVYC